MNQRGFTLLELIVVIALVALAYTLASQSFGGGFLGAELKGAARDVAAGLREARSVALSQRKETALALDLEKRTFTLGSEGQVHRLPEKLELKLYTAQSEVSSDKTGAIRFYPDGSSTGGRVTLSARERKFLVDVDWLTGRVTISE
jgi:general secretion pathway protein H